MTLTRGLLLLAEAFDEVLDGLHRLGVNVVQQLLLELLQPRPQLQEDMALARSVKALVHTAHHPLQHRVALAARPPAYLFDVRVEGDRHVQQDFALLHAANKVLDPVLELVGGLVDLLRVALARLGQLLGRLQQLVRIDTELQTLVQPHFAVLPDVLQLSLVVQHLVDDVQDVVHRLGVVRCGRQCIGAAWGQRSLQLVQQGFAILAHLRREELEHEVPTTTTHSN
ncbi:hypothetical protein EYF80_014264 [Liparis tanakae]|uniref:Uncharacterized protein n=1 Tax=Liparis tanakae TaxID=230148 RepID=A0A4Z2IDR7_9TELE|nr:hypothetical protein EYF80_014264 [Liparis tanakae]